MSSNLWDYYKESNLGLRLHLKPRGKGASMRPPREMEI